MNYTLRLIAAACCLAIFSSANSQTTAPAPHKRKHSFYFSWGYNSAWYANSTVHVKQESLGNDYAFRNVDGHDNEGWNQQSIFKMDLTIPQYNYRIGYMLNEERGIGLEINFDHTKFIISDNQNLRITGRLQDRDVDTTVRFAGAEGFHYYLNNGANFFLINIVKRKKLGQWSRNRFRLDALGKAGIGPVVPHVDNSFFGKENEPHFQFGGWNAGVEADLKATFFRYAYLEYGLKLDYARYSGLKIYEGTARQAFGTFEMILSLGVNIPGRK